jgi:hypothetical protein
MIFGKSYYFNYYAFSVKILTIEIEYEYVGKEEPYGH